MLPIAFRNDPLGNGPAVPQPATKRIRISNSQCIWLFSFKDRPLSCEGDSPDIEQGPVAESSDRGDEALSFLKRWKFLASKRLSDPTDGLFSIKSGILLLIMKANEMHYFSDLFDKVLYIFRTGPVYLIRNISTLYTSNGYL